jgi:hypothetical protein
MLGYLVSACLLQRCTMLAYAPFVTVWKVAIDIQQESFTKTFHGQNVGAARSRDQQALKMKHSRLRAAPTNP